MFWLLLGLLVLLTLLALGATLFTLYRRVRVLGKQVASAGDTVGALTSTLDDLQAGRPGSTGPCPTCGAPAQLAKGRSAAVRPQGAR